MVVTVSRDSCDVLDLFCCLNLLRKFLKAKHDFINSRLDTSAKIHWVHASSYGFAAFFVDSTSEDRSGGRSVTSLIIGLASNLLDKVSTDVVEPVGELDVFSYCHTILCDLRHSEAAVNDNIASTGSKGDLDSVGKHLTALEHEGASFSSELNFLTSKVELRGLDKGFVLHADLSKVHAGSVPDS